MRYSDPSGTTGETNEQLFFGRTERFRRKAQSAQDRGTRRRVEPAEKPPAPAAPGGGGKKSGGSSGGGSGKGGEAPVGGDILTGPGLDPNDPLNGNLDLPSKKGGTGKGGTGPGGEGSTPGGVKESKGRKLAELAGDVSFAEAEEGGSEFGVPGGGAEKGALLDNEEGQLLAAGVIIADAIASAISLGKAFVELLGKLGGELLEKLGKELFKGLDEAVEEGITKGAKEGIDDLTPRFDPDAIKKAKGEAAVAKGLAREQKVADLVGGKVSRQKIKTQFGSSDIDVIGPAGELIAVGGPAKAGNLSKLGTQLKVLVEAAKQRGVAAKAAFEAGTPQAAIELAVKKLGAENVILF